MTECAILRLGSPPSSLRSDFLANADKFREMYHVSIAENLFYNPIRVI